MIAKSCGMENFGGIYAQIMHKKSLGVATIGRINIFNQMLNQQHINHLICVQ